jgi:hypothetical protein
VAGKTKKELRAAAFGAASHQTFGSQLLAAMRRKGWTQVQTAQEVSRRLGESFNPVNLSDYVHGRSHPGPRYRKALIEALDLTDGPAEPIPVDHRPHSEDGHLSLRKAGLSRDSIRLEDRRDGSVLLEIKQHVPWPLALKVLELLKSDPPH